MNENMTRSSNDPQLGISIVIPVYGCAVALPLLYRRLLDVLEGMGESFELILVDDRCPHGSWPEIMRLAEADSRVVGVHLSRNFSQHRAILAGLDLAAGDWVLVMDCDLQDRPESIPLLMAQRDRGFDIVIATRENRKDSWIKTLSSKLFTQVFNYMTEANFREDETNFSLFSRRVLVNLRRLRERNAFFLLNLHWVGFRLAYVPVEHGERAHGKSSYNLISLLRLAGDSIIAHSNKPLRIMVAGGFLLALLSIVYALWLILKYFLFGLPVEGWTSIMVSMYFLFGLMFANIGILGLYIGRSFNETKDRPLYVVEEILNPGNRTRS